MAAVRERPVRETASHSNHAPLYRRAAPEPARREPFDLDTFWPAIPGGVWPEGFTVSREQIYDDAGRLTGGPQENAGRNR